MASSQAAALKADAPAAAAAPHDESAASLSTSLRALAAPTVGAVSARLVELQEVQVRRLAHWA